MYTCLGLGKFCSVFIIFFLSSSSGNLEWFPFLSLIAYTKIKWYGSFVVSFTRRVYGRRVYIRRDCTRRVSAHRFHSSTSVLPPSFVGCCLLIVKPIVDNSTFGISLHHSCHVRQIILNPLDSRSFGSSMRIIYICSKLGFPVLLLTINYKLKTSVV